MPRKRCRVVLKSLIFGQNFEEIENFRKDDNSIERGAAALRVIRARARLAVHRLLR